MFWGLVLEPGKRYAKVVDNSFHISAAVLDTSASEKDIVRVMVEVDEVETLIANLSVKHGILQCPLDLSFGVGSHVAFYTTGGKMPVHLSGQAIEEYDDELGDTGEDDEDSEEEIPNLVDISPSKRKLDDKSPVARKKSKMIEYKQGKANMNMNKILTIESENVDDDEGDDDSDEEDSEGEELVGEEEEDDDSDEDDDDDVDTEDEDDEVPETIKGSLKLNKANGAARTPVPEKIKSLQQTPKSEKKALAKQSTPWEKTKQNAPKSEGKPVSQTPKTPEKMKATPGKNNQKMKNTPSAKKQTTPTGQDALKQGKKTPKQEKAINGKILQVETPKKIADKSPQGTPQGKPTKVVKQGGVTCEDLVVGTGPDAKRGKMVSVYYEGRLMNTNKMFDKCDSGRGFKFRLGQGEVISGWDVGVAGMKAGGKRRIVCPPNMAYGKNGALPAIPPHSTLSFVVELKSIT